MTRRPPAAALVLAGVASALFLAPIAGLLWRVPWRALTDSLFTPQVGRALALSMVTSLGATAIGVVLGVPLAWVFSRTHFPGRRVLRAVVVLPMVLPPVVGGVALLLAFGRRGLIGQYLFRWFGISLPFTTAAAVMAAAFVAIPFLVVTVEAGFRSLEPRYEEAARTLGATPGHVFWRVTLPLLRPSLAAGALLCWARALGEFGATITFAGNVPGRTQTLPLAVYLDIEGAGLGTGIALSLVLLAISLGVLVALRDRWLQ